MAPGFPPGYLTVRPDADDEGREGAYAAVAAGSVLDGSLMTGKRIWVRRGRVMQTAYLDNLHAEGLEPGQEPCRAA